MPVGGGNRVNSVGVKGRKNRKTLSRVHGVSCLGNSNT